jgi:hypothetical protein
MIHHDQIHTTLESRTQPARIGRVRLRDANASFIAQSGDRLFGSFIDGETYTPASCLHDSRQCQTTNDMARTDGGASVATE